MVTDAESRALKLNGAARRKLRNARVMRRDGHQCVLCGTTTSLTVQHIRPKVVGGSGDDRNLVTMCSVCHRGMQQVNAWIAQQLTGWLLWPFRAALVWLGRARWVR